MARSIRAQITWLATSVTLGVCILVCLGLYVGLHLLLYREVDGFLMGEVHEFRAILTHESDDGLPEIETEIRAELGSRSNSDLAFRLLDGGGRLLITSLPDDRFPNPWPSAIPEKSGGSDPSFETLDNVLPSPYRICSERADIAPHGRVIVQAAYRVDRVQRSLSICRGLCIVAIAVAAGLSFAGGRAVAGRSLKPVVRMTQVARDISGQHLSDRVALSGTGDELDTLAQTLNDMLARVEQSFTQIRQFTADAAHELRTPLTALRGSAEHVLAQPRTAEQLRAVIEKSLEYYRLLGRVTDDLLLLARIDAGQEPLRIERFDLVPMIHDLVDLYRPLAAERGIDMSFWFDSPPVEIEGDSSKVRRVLNNVVDNAIKYMNGPGSVKVALAAEQEFVRIEVVDSGPGIPEKAISRIFERFFRLDAARTATRGAAERGAGLGLSICQSLVRLHGGRISLENGLPRGVKVTIQLPRRVDVAASSCSMA